MELLVVMGMHRSGTSVVAASLEALGWDVGPPEDLMPPKEDNPRGFVEHIPAVNLSERVLRRLGGSWDAPPGLPPGWEHSDVLDDLRLEATEVIDALLNHGTGPHLLKDPRLSLTLPFWQQVAPVEDAVLVLRPPDPVIRSLRRRDPDLTVAEGAALYVRYLLAALRASARLHVVDPGRLLANPRETLRELVDALGRQVDAARLNDAVAVHEESLWGRSSRDPGELEPCTDLDLARVCHELVTGEDGTSWMTRFGRLEMVDALASLAAHHGRTTDDLRDRLAQATSDLARVRSERDGRSSRMRETTAKLKDTQDRLVQLRDQRDGLVDEVERLRAESAETTHLLALRGAALESAMEEAQLLRARLATDDELLDPHTSAEGTQ